jgi:tetratricopeptide (TPR) repeat protein
MATSSLPTISLSNLSAMPIDLDSLTPHPSTARQATRRDWARLPSRLRKEDLRVRSSSPGRVKLLLLASLILGTLLASASGCQWAASGQNAQGTRLYQQGQYSAALQEFQKAIASDPQNPDGYYNLAATTHRLGLQRQDSALISQAEALYNQCLDHAPNHVECHRGLAVLLVDTGRPDRAFALLKNWAAQNPTFAEARIELARLYEEAGEMQTALKYLEDAVQTDANNARAWLALGRLREQRGELTQALQNYQRSYAVNPMQPMVSERIAALSRQITSQYDAALSQGGTRMAQPLPGGNQRY